MSIRPAVCAGLLLAVLFTGGGNAAADENKPLWLVVGRPELVSAIKPLAALRRSQGLAALVLTGDVKTALSKAPRQPAFLLLVENDAPKWAQPWLISSDPRHPLCGWPPEQPHVFTKQMRKSGSLSLLMGHANAEHFFSMKHEQRSIWYNAAAAARQLAKGPPSAPLVCFTCDSGDFARAGDCMAESFLWFPGGPVATVAATTESHPLPNYYSSVSLLREMERRPMRLGQLWLAAQRGAAKQRNFLIESVLKDVEGKLENRIDVARLRRDNLLMYSLLGDPATKLRMPRPLTARVELVDGTWRWRVDRPAGTNKLHVSFRLAAKHNYKLKRRENAAAARAEFEAANAAFAFNTIEMLGADRAWAGSVEKPGWLRLVATGPGVLHACVIQLKPQR